MAKSTYPTLQEIRDAHAGKREYERYLPLSRYVFRPLGFLLTWISIRIGLTSEAVSWLSGFVGLVGFLCLLSAQKQFLPIGIGLLLFFNLLDCVDGSIARTMNTQNPYGRFLDSLMGWVDMGFWALIGVMAYRHPKLLYLSDPMGHGPFFWLAVGGLTSYFSILLSYVENTFDKFVRDGWDSIRTNIEMDSRKITQERKAAETVHKKILPFLVMSIIRKINHNLRVRETHYFLLILAYLVNLVDLFLATFLIYYVLHTISLIFIYSLRGKQVRNSKM